MYDLSTQAGALHFCESKRAEMVRCFERVGRFEENGESFCAYIFATHAISAPKNARRTDDFKTGRKLERPVAELVRLPNNPLVQLLSPPQQKDCFAHVVSCQAKLQKAIGYVLLSEMWHAKARTKEERNEWPDSLEYAPGRGEALFMAVEHQALGQKSWKAEILREPTRLLEWETLDLQESEGRFIDLTDWRS